MKKLVSFIMSFVMLLVLVACQSITEDLSIYTIAGSLSVGEDFITKIEHYTHEGIENSYLIIFENGDILNISDDNTIEYMMGIDTDYTNSLISIYGVYGELDSALVQIILTIGNAPSTGRIDEFDLTIERDSLDITFDSYINNANISEDDASELFNDNGLVLVSRIRNIFENIFDVDFK